MSKVHRLDSSTINKIAAGEVVERPASVVKELVENAIDAGATRIEVEIQNGGKDLIRVSDNGCGMNAEDASLSICRHATSKIVDAKDLTNISTLGFRGEALPTIMSVSNFKMRTRQQDSELGTYIGLKGGLNQDLHEIGCPLGTTIQVEDLFFNTPARKKFLKTTATEGAKIHDYIVKLALSRPSIAFKFINGNRNDINTPGTGNLLDTVTSIYGSEISDFLLEIDFTDKNDENFKIKGYISKPNVLKSYRSWQTFIVNGRIVNNRIIFKAVDEAYKSMIPKTGYPLAILIFEIPPQNIDVNVHPQKTEIRFEDEGDIYRAVFAAIRQALDDKSFVENEIDDSLKNIAVTPSLGSRPKFQSRPVEHSVNQYDLANVKEMLSRHKERFSDELSNKLSNKSSSEFLNELQNKSPNKSLNEFLNKSQNKSSNKSPNEFPNELPNDFSDKVMTSSLTIPKKISPIGQVDLCYIIARDDHDLYIVDQHAAHERILFDKFSGYTDGVPAQQLLIHQILKFDDKESQILENNLELFRNLGFTMEPSGENEFRLIEIPVDLDGNDSEDLLREILSNLPPIDEIETVDEENNDEQQKIIARNIRQSCLATTACRAAIKAGQELNFRQMQILLDQLSKTSNPYTCPHGRPTIIRFGSHDLAKMFKRTGF